MAAPSDYDLLQKFVKNEQRSKTWTLVSVIGFCCFAFAALYMADKLNQANQTIAIKDQDLQQALAKADSLNNSLKGNEVSLENIHNTVDQMKREKDSLISLLKLVSKPNPSAAEKTIVQNKVLTSIWQNNITPKYTIYIQYMPGYEAESKAVRNLLQRSYSVPGIEGITKINFASSIKYFNDSDKGTAAEIAAAINRSIDRFKTDPIKIVKTSMNVSKGQLEIWLGEYKQLNTKQIIDKYNSQ